MKIEYKSKDYLYKQSKVLQWKLKKISLHWPYTLKDWYKVYKSYPVLGESIYNKCVIERNENGIIIDKDLFTEINKKIKENYKNNILKLK